MRQLNVWILITLKQMKDTFDGLIKQKKKRSSDIYYEQYRSRPLIEVTLDLWSREYTLHLLSADDTKQLSRFSLLPDHESKVHDETFLKGFSVWCKEGGDGISREPIHRKYSRAKATHVQP